MFWFEIGLGFGEHGGTTSPRIPRSKPRASSLKSSVIPNLKMIEMIILGGKTTIIRNNICAHCLRQVCAVAHADHATRNHNYLFKNSFDPKTANFALFARFFDDQTFF